MKSVPFVCCPMAHLLNFPVTRLPVTLNRVEVSRELGQRSGNYLVGKNEKVLRWAGLRASGPRGGLGFSEPDSETLLGTVNPSSAGLSLF